MGPALRERAAGRPWKLVVRCARRVFYFTAGGFGILVRSSVELDSASGQYDGETLPHAYTDLCDCWENTDLVKSVRY